MSDMNAIFDALSILAKQNRELSDRVAELEAARDDHHERLTAHGMLLTTPRRSEVVRHYAAQLAAMNYRHDEDAISDLRIEQFRERQYRAILACHPECRDPAHPGCERCEDRDGNPVEPEECFS